LEGTDGRGLEAEIGLEVLRDLTNETLEWQLSFLLVEVLECMGKTTYLSDQQLGGLLVAADFSQGNSSGLVAMGLLDTTSLGKH
jgi:hypothetical protein